MLWLSNPKDNQSECMAKFMKDKFPNEWEIAIKNTEEENKEMIELQSLD
ncbi:MAG: hypothetical protein GX638_08825 [Crenarchaeota archaeon]|nr:hypothetical protein [Thermoproteota archaeon]